MIYPPDFCARSIETARSATHDIVECDRAEVDVMWEGVAPYQTPHLRFVFTHLLNKGRTRGCPTFCVQLHSQSRSNPMAERRLVEGDRLRRHVRDSVERYFKAEGLDLTRKALANASL